MLWLLFVGLVSAQNSCYYAAGRRAGSAIIPCGGGTGVQPCCQIGDLCLADSACWNPTYNVTYLYGCTDSTYTDASCPYKCGDDFASAPYVGLDYCYNTTRNEWSCTHPPNNSEAIVPFGAAECVDDSIIAFAGPSVLQPILSLPTAVGGSTLYFSQVNPTSYTPVAGYTPSSTIRYTASVPTNTERVSTTSGSGVISSVSNTAIATGTVSSTSSSPTATGSSSSGLSTGAKAGIGAGVGGGAIAIALVVIAWMFMRRRRTHQPVPKEEMSQTSDHTESAYPTDKKVRPGPAELAETPARNSGPSELPESDRHSWGATAGSTTDTNTYSNYTRPTQGGDQVHELG